MVEASEVSSDKEGHFDPKTGEKFLKNNKKDFKAFENKNFKNRVLYIQKNGSGYLKTAIDDTNSPLGQVFSPRTDQTLTKEQVKTMNKTLKARQERLFSPWKRISKNVPKKSLHQKHASQGQKSLNVKTDHQLFSALMDEFLNKSWINALPSSGAKAFNRPFQALDVFHKDPFFAESSSPSNPSPSMSKV